MYFKIENTHFDLFILPIMRTYSGLVHVGSVLKDTGWGKSFPDIHHLRSNRANR